MTSLHELGIRARRTASPGRPDAPIRSRPAPHPDVGAYFGAYAAVLAQAAASVDQAALGRAAALLVDAYSCGSTVFTCGNGGSASIANHMQCDHVKGVRTTTDLSPRVVSLSANIELLTAIANDCSYVRRLRPPASGAGARR